MPWLSGKSGSSRMISTGSLARIADASLHERRAEPPYHPIVPITALPDLRQDISQEESVFRLGFDQQYTHSNRPVLVRRTVSRSSQVFPL